MLPVEHTSKLSRAKLYRKIRGNPKHPLHDTINRRQRNAWTTEIHECHRLASTQLEEPTQLQRDDTTLWEQLPYKCRIDWTREGTEILKQRLLEYIRSQPDDNTYYTDGSIPAHTGIPGNEKDDQAAKRGLQLDRKHTTVNTSTFRVQTKMKEQMERHYNEQAYNDASQ